MLCFGSEVFVAKASANVAHGQAGGEQGEEPMETCRSARTQRNQVDLQVPKFHVRCRGRSDNGRALLSGRRV